MRESRSAWIWGAGIPTLTVLAAALVSPWAVALLLLYPLQVLRLYLRARHTKPVAGWYAFFLVLGKLPEALGQTKFMLNRIRGRRATLIEYK